MGSCEGGGGAEGHVKGVGEEERCRGARGERGEVQGVMWGGGKRGRGPGGVMWRENLN